MATVPCFSRSEPSAIRKARRVKQRGTLAISARTSLQPKRSDALPRAVRVESGHLRGHRGCLRSKVLLVDDTVVIDDKGRYSRVAVGRGIGDQRKSTDHLTARDVIVGPAFRIGALGLEDAIV